MSRLVSVNRADRRLAASFTIEGDGEPVVDCAGTLRELTEPSAAELLLAWFAAACKSAGRRCPGGLRVRATSSLAVDDRLTLTLATASAAAAAANALLGLGLDEAAVARASGDAVRRALGPRDDVVVSTDVVSEYRVAARESCPD